MKPLLLAASPGGHLDLLRAVAPSLDGRPAVWVTSPSPGAQALAEAGERVSLVPLFRRSPGALARNLRATGRILRAHPDATIVTSGASGVLPLCVFARALGRPVVFVETMARIENFSRTGDVLRRIARRTLVQWPDLLAVDPDAVACRPVLLDRPVDPPSPTRTGTMVALGTHGQPFDRLIAAVERARVEGLLPEPVLVQTGATTDLPAGLQSVPYLPPDEFGAALHGCERFVCHAGAGIISRALRAGHRPIVFPRLARHGEHVDDHQLQIARRIESFGLAVVIETAITAEDVARAAAPVHAPPSFADLPTVESELRRVLAEIESR